MRGRCRGLFLFSLDERVGNLLASIEGRDEHEEGATRDQEAELAMRSCAFLV